MIQVEVRLVRESTCLNGTSTAAPARVHPLSQETYGPAAFSTRLRSLRQVLRLGLCPTECRGDSHARPVFGPVPEGSCGKSSPQCRCVPIRWSRDCLCRPMTWLPLQAGHPDCPFEFTPHHTPSSSPDHGMAHSAPSPPPGSEASSVLVVGDPGRVPPAEAGLKFVPPDSPGPG